MRNIIFDTTARNEEGFILVLTLVILLLLTLFGVWALNSSDFENRVAANIQQAERVFNANEGANYSEGSKIVNGRRPWFVVDNPNSKYRVMLPDSQEAFDPFMNFGDPRGADDALTTAKNKAKDAEGRIDDAPIKRQTEYWPWDNFGGEYRNAPDGSRDYRYLITYLYWDTAPQGEDAVSGGGGSASFKFRVQAGLEGQNGIVESGGIAVGGSVE